MERFFVEGGSSMWLTTFIGFALNAAAMLLVIRLHRLWRTVGILALTTLTSGTLGTILGLVNTFKYASHVEQSGDFSAVLTAGAAESLNNITLALMMLLSAGIACAAAAYRLAHPSQSPHT